MASISDSVSVSKRGQTLHSQARGIIWNVYNYFKSQSGETGIYELLDRTAVATNVSPYSVRRIVEAGKAGLASSDADTPAAAAAETSFTTPGKKRPHPAPVTDLDEFDLSLIRASVSELHPTIDLIHSKLVSRMGFTGSKTSLSRILHGKLGMKYGKVDSRKFYIERPDIVAHRRYYLRQILMVRTSYNKIKQTIRNNTCAHGWCV